MAAVAVLLAVLLAAAVQCVGSAEAAASKRSYGFRVQSRDLQPHTTFRRSLLRNSSMPLHGAVKDYGYFYATLYLGTPAKKFAVIVDTGSTMTYVPCSTCGSGCGPNHQDAAFDPEASSSASLIPCTSPKCSCGSPHCGCAAQQCTYTRSYAEQSSSSGVLLEDVLALHDGLPGAPIIFGCETRETGEIFKQRADGLFGLGNSDASVVNQLVKAGVIDDVFSLCFGMVEGDGALLLGDAVVPGSIALQYTPLLTSTSHPFYYNVKMLSLAVDGRLLPVAQSLFDQGYGTVLDSGTTFTYMPSPVFKAFAAAVESFALSHGLKRVPGPDAQYDDICFGQAPSHDDLQALSNVFPAMEIQFDQGTSLVLGPLNYLFVHTFNSGKYCLGVFDNGRAGTLLGGITFRNVLVRYDRGSRRVGFGPAPCKELGEMQRPPCSYFAGHGSEGLSAAAAAAEDGDCVMDSARQQQETYEDVEDSEQQLDEPGTGSSSETASQRRSPEDVPQQATDMDSQQDLAKQQAQAQEQQQEQSVADTLIDRPEHAGQRAAAGSVQQQGGGGADSSSLSAISSSISVAVGLLVAVVAVLSLGFAVALLQPAIRDRIRSALGGSRQYRSLEEEERDPEGALLPAAAPAAAGSGGGEAPGAGHLKSVELGPVADPRPRGITTPQKLQRTVSNSTEEAAAALGGTPTPRASAAPGQSPMRSQGTRTGQ